MNVCNHNICEYLTNEMVSESVESGYKICHFLHCDKHDIDFYSAAEAALNCINCDTNKMNIMRDIKTQ